MATKAEQVKPKSRKRLRLDEAKIDRTLQRAATAHATNGHAAEQRSELTPLEVAALRLESKDKIFDRVRDQLQPGRGQQVDVTLRIKGAIDVGGESHATVSERLNTSTVVALLIASLPDKQRQRTLDHLVERCAEYVQQGTAPVPPLEATALADTVLDRISRSKQQARRGTVSGSLSVTVISRENAAADAT